eukprot:11359182-Prorocentrum_lima.AAC.1
MSSSCGESATGGFGRKRQRTVSNKVVESLQAAGNSLEDRRNSQRIQDIVGGPPKEPITSCIHGGPA